MAASAGEWRARRPACGASAATLGLALLAFAGCATPGPLHVYALDPTSEAAVQDEGSDGTRAEVPSFLEQDDTVTGFACDPFTDHFFLRLAPGNAIRVVDRPARAIKREFVIDGAPTNGGGDLAVRPRDGHLFLLHPSEPAVLEATRLGKMVRALPLGASAARPVGIAYDSVHDQLLLLASDGRRIAIHASDGRRVGELTLDREAGPSLAFDSEHREIYAPVRGSPGQIGVFDEQGRFRRMLATRGTFIDVGPRSFIRVF